MIFYNIQLFSFVGYARANQQQQQQATSVDSNPHYIGAPQPADVPRSRSPGTPPLPDLPHTQPEVLGQVPPLVSDERKRPRLEDTVAVGGDVQTTDGMGLSGSGRRGKERKSRWNECKGTTDTKSNFIIVVPYVIGALCVWILIPVCSS